MATQPLPKLTLEEYLEQEQTSETAHEYHGGEILEIEAASPEHAQICAQVTAALMRAFPTCTTYANSLCVYTEAEDQAVYPDATVICGEPETIKVKGMPLAVTNPHVLVEVFSPSTRSYDRTGKSGMYRQIRSLEHIVLVAQDRLFVEHFRRTGPTEWAISQWTSLTDTVSFGSGGELALSAIYDRVKLS